MLDYLLNALITLFVTIDPIGLAPIFVGLTRGMSRGQRRQTAIRATVTATIILYAFALIGEGLLTFLGISLAAFRISGGLLLFWIAFEMVFERRQDRKEKTTEIAITQDHIRNIAVFPLALPLIAGPGAISATILLASSLQTTLDRAQLIGVIAVNLGLVFAALAISDRLDRMLGATGRAILTRLLGVILAALAAQFVVDGARAALKLP